MCRQSKGDWAGQPLTLMDWQRDFLWRLFGWVHKDTGARRFRSCYLEVAKKNGKSTLLSGLALHGLLFDKEGAAEIYLNAVDRKQASIIFEEAARMVEKSPDLSSRLQVVRSSGNITDPINYGFIRKNSADSPSADGVNASRVFFDELHRLKKRDLWDVMQYAGASRRQPLRISITTAGEQAEGPWYEQREYSEQVNAGIIPDIRHLGVVHRVQPGDDLDSPDVWRRANPSLGITISEEDFGREWEEAKRVPTLRANFLRLRFNIIAAGPSKFIEDEQWDRCGATPILGAGEPAYMGVDLSESQDLTALVTIKGNATEGIDVDARFWLPKDNIVDLEHKHQAPYREWARMGHIVLTDGRVVDYDFVRAEINRIVRNSDIRRIMMDPYNAVKLGIQLLEHDGLPVEELRQGFLSLSPPTKQLLRLILGGKLRHGSHPILRWHASNAVVVRDAAGNIKLHKEKSKKKIDGLAALVNAVAAMDSDPIDNEPSVYEKRGLLFV
jgi:phage terminase large subunit-like protein